MLRHNNKIFYSIFLSALFHICFLALVSEQPIPILITKANPPARSLTATFIQKNPVSIQPYHPSLEPTLPEENTSIPAKFAPPLNLKTSQLESPSKKTPEALFYDSTSLTTHPIPIGTIEFLSLTAPTSIAGSATINVKIDDKGIVISVSVINSSLDKDTILPTINAIKRTPFTPGEIDGISVPCSINVKIDLESIQPSW